MNIEIVRQVSELEQKVWHFYFISDYRVELRFQYYKLEQRPTKRHKFRVAGFWNGYSRDNTILERPEVPPDVEAELRTKVKELADKAEIK